MDIHSLYILHLVCSIYILSIYIDIYIDIYYTYMIVYIHTTT